MIGGAEENIVILGTHNYRLKCFFSSFNQPKFSKNFKNCAIIKCTKSDEQIAFEMIYEGEVLSNDSKKNEYWTVEDFNKSVQNFKYNIPPNTIIYLVRHGQGYHNIVTRLTKVGKIITTDDIQDANLTTEGINQAKRAGEYFVLELDELNILKKIKELNTKSITLKNVIETIKIKKKIEKLEENSVTLEKVIELNQLKEKLKKMKTIEKELEGKIKKPASLKEIIEKDTLRKELEKIEELKKKLEVIYDLKKLKLDKFYIMNELNELKLKLIGTDIIEELREIKKEELKKLKKLDEIELLEVELEKFKSKDIYSQFKFNLVASHLKRTHQTVGTIASVLMTNGYILGDHKLEIYINPCAHEVHYISTGNCDSGFTGKIVGKIAVENIPSCIKKDNIIDYQCKTIKLPNGYIFNINWDYYTHFKKDEKLKCSETNLIQETLKSYSYTRYELRSKNYAVFSMEPKLEKLNVLKNYNSKINTKISNKDKKYYNVKQILYGPKGKPFDFVLVDIDNEIAAGKQGTVYESCIKDNCNYILKKYIYKNVSNLEEYEKDFLNEIKLHNKAAMNELTDYIVLAYKIIESNQLEFGYIMKKYTKTLRDYLSKSNNSLTDKQDMIDKACLIIKKLNEIQICHGDAHLDNFMIDEKGELKIIDFGSAKEIKLEDTECLEREFDQLRQNIIESNVSRISGYVFYTKTKSLTDIIDNYHKQDIVSISDINSETPVPISLSSNN